MAIQLAARAGARVFTTAGTAAKLDVSTSFGRIRNQLESTDGPQETDETIDLRARSGYGDIVIRRSTGASA